MIAPGEAAAIDALAQREALRKAMRHECDALDARLVREWGQRVERGVLEIIDRRRLDRTFLYLSIPGEVPTLSLAQRLLSAGHLVAAPRLRRGCADMELRQVRDLDADIRAGLWHIPIPTKRCPLVDPETIEVAVVPLTAVDVRGNRIGRGGGYYDRFLAANPHVYAVGVGFEMQRVETCTPQPWDVPLEVLVTEEQTRFFTESGSGSR